MAERITGHTELIGLMAYPIRHSSSPAMHNEAFAYLGFDYAYLAFEIGADEIEDAVKAIRTLNRADAQQVPIIALSANAFEEDKMQSAKAGMNAHLSKPVNVDLLFKTMEQLLHTF